MMFPVPAPKPVANANSNPLPKWVLFFRFFEKGNDTVKETWPTLEKIWIMEQERSRLAMGDSRLQMAHISIENIQPAQGVVDLTNRDVPLGSGDLWRIPAHPQGILRIGLSGLDR